MLTLASAFMSGVMADMATTAAIEQRWLACIWEVFLCLVNGGFAIRGWRESQQP